MIQILVPEMDWVRERDALITIYVLDQSSRNANFHAFFFENDKAFGTVQHEK